MGPEILQLLQISEGRISKNIREVLAIVHRVFMKACFPKPKLLPRIATVKRSIMSVLITLSSLVIRHMKSFQFRSQFEAEALAHSSGLSRFYR